LTNNGTSDRSIAIVTIDIRKFSLNNFGAGWWIATALFIVNAF
jgi:hypothetical protein